MGLDIIEHFVLGVIRGALNNNIGRFTPYQLQEAINENRNLWGATPPEMRQKIQGYKNRFEKQFDKYIEEVTTSLLVDWLQKDQPALHTVILSSLDNYKWFNAQVERYVTEIKTM